jgi:hypothetical protein
MTMFLSFTDKGYFTLRPKGAYHADVDACVKADNPLSLVRCDDESAMWKVHGGQVVSVRDSTLCLAHNLG